MSQFCHSCVTVTSQLCQSYVTVLSQLCHSFVTVVSQLCHTNPRPDFLNNACLRNLKFFIVLQFVFTVQLDLCFSCDLHKLLQTLVLNRELEEIMEISSIISLIGKEDIIIFFPWHVVSQLIQSQISPNLTVSVLLLHQ